MSKSSTVQNSLMLVMLIGATDSWTRALGLWLMFIVVISAYGISMGALRSRLTPTPQLMAGVVLAATLTSCVELAVQVWALQWHQHSGFYAGLIALQCVVLDHNGFFRDSWRDRLRLYGVFGALMVGMAVMREFLGEAGLHIATLVPGGFILLGLLIAAWQAWNRPTPSQ